MKRRIGMFGALLLFSLSGVAPAVFLPEEDILDQKKLPIGPSNMEEGEFNELIKYVDNIYRPIVTSHGGNLSIQAKWSNETLNARASQLGNLWRVEITGGLARRPELTPDGFTLILCHELGHHLGGFAFADPLPLPIPAPDGWAASEGQSDYYATQVCNRRLWAEQKEKNAAFRDSVSESGKTHCDQTWQNEDDQDLCYRTAVATESMILTMATLKGVEMPSFDTPDTSTVDKTISKHPAVQCRMDTSLQGALCTASFDDGLIPGKGMPGGVHGEEAEIQAYQNSCAPYSGFDIGSRPACWFKHRL